MKDFIYNQVQHFSLFTFLFTTLFTVLWTRTNTNKEIKTMSQQITADFQKLSSEVNQNANMLAEQIGTAAKK